jgi:serine/threonine-protein kinase RsbW
MQEDDVHQLELAVSEATANIMKHAYAGSTDERVSVEAAAFEHSVMVTLRDTGAAFSPDNQPTPNLNGLRSGGMGLYIINSCVDHAVYSRSDDGYNELRLTRLFGK